MVKPSGLLSVPGRGEHLQDSLYTRILGEYPLAQMVHRLDMDTSGVMVVALRRKAERALKEQFRVRTVKKRYEAIVAGVPSRPTGTIDQPLKPHPTLKLRHVVNPAGKPSRTEYTTIRSHQQYSWLGLRPHTGRSHQLRVHLEHLGCPIVGDRFYAPSDVCSRSNRLMLHASELTFAHPYSGEEIHCVAPSGFASWWNSHRE